LSAILVFGWLTTALASATISVGLDRNPVPQDEAFTILFTLDASPDGDPDFSPLQKDFEVLGQTQSNQMNMVNGQVTRRLIYQVTVMARRAGDLTVPTVHFGKDVSKPFPVTITHGAVQGKQAGDAALFIEVEADPKNPYVQAQTLFTIRVLTRVPFSGDLSQPEVKDAVIEKLDNDREYVTERQGVQYKVDERRYAVFPQKSGEMNIPAINLTAQVAIPNPNMFSPSFVPKTRQQRFHSDPVKLSVRPIPQEFSGKVWIPASSLTLTEQWSGNGFSITAGEPLTRTLKLQGESVTAGLLPEFSLDALGGSDLQQYPDHPIVKEDKANSGFTSSRELKVAYIGQTPGTYTLKPIQIPWWNTRTDRMEMASLPAVTLTVLPSTKTDAGDPPLPKAEVKPEDESKSVQGMSLKPLEGEWALMRKIIVGSLGLGTIVCLYWFFRVRWKRDGSRKSIRGNIKKFDSDHLRELERYARANQASATLSALRRWIDRQEAKDSGCSDFTTDDSWLREVDLLEAAVYGRDPDSWSRGAIFWESFQRVLAGPPKNLKDFNPRGKREALEPLYKGT
jgi:hypothetical protein